MNLSLLSLHDMDVWVLGERVKSLIGALFGLPLGEADGKLLGEQDGKKLRLLEGESLGEVLGL